MNEEFQDIHESDLTSSERASLRNRILAFMAEHPARAPLTVRLLDRLESFLDGLERTPLLSARAMVPALALVLVVGIGTSFAAEGALPGDALYPIKVLFNEPFGAALQRSDSAKAKWESTLVSRRLEEAEALAAKGQLTPSVQEALQSSIALSATEFNASVAKLAEVDDVAVVRAQSQFEASLAGHEEVLTKLSRVRDEDARSIAPILASISAQKLTLAVNRATVEAKVATRDGASVRTIAATTRKRAKTAVADVQSAINSQRTPSAAVRVSNTLAQNSINEGDSEYEQGNYAKAFMAFQAATREAGSAQVQVDAQALFSVPGVGATTSATSTATTTLTTATSTATTTEQ